MKITFEQLKQAMLDNGWGYESLTYRKGSTRLWDHVFTKGVKQYWRDDNEPTSVMYSYRDEDWLSIKQLYKKITKGKKMKQPTLKIKKLYPNIELPTPTYATSGSAGIDLCAMLDSCDPSCGFLLEPEDCEFINTGIAVSIPKGYVGLIMPRSGLGTKGLVLGNLTGVIDSDYRGEIILQLWNRSNAPITINNLDRVAQMLIVPVAQPVIEVVDELDITERGDKGFGSTGQ